jgi:uncharacterized protein (UPF0333 family)
MKNKGQISIEFIMLILIIVIYLLTITRPLVNDSKSVIEDVHLIVRTESESKRIINSIIEVAMLGEGSKKTLELQIPQNAKIFCNTDNSISFDLNLQKPLDEQISECDNNTCCLEKNCKKKTILNNIELNCNFGISNELSGNTSLIVLNSGKIEEKTKINLTEEIN